MNNNKLFEKYGELSLQELSQELYESASQGNLEELKYILTSPELKLHPAIHFAEDSALVVASSNGHIPILEYILNIPYYREQALTNHSLLKAFLHNQLETAKFLLDSDTIPFKADIHAKEDYIFRELLMAKNKEILSYLIFDREISKTQYIEEYLTRDSYNLNDFISEIKVLFELRELNKGLNQDLHENSESKKKLKL